MILIRPYYEIESYIYEDEILKHIEKAARTCYKSEHQIGDFEKTKKFVAGVIKRGHETVIEHYSVSVRFIIDRGISHELVRHRLAVYSQESTRYASYNKDQFSNQITYIIPPWIDLKEGEYTIGNNITWKNPDGILIDIEVNDDNLLIGDYDTKKAYEETLKFLTLQKEIVMLLQNMLLDYYLLWQTSW